MNHSFLSDQEIEQQLLQVKFHKEIKYLYEEMDDGDFFEDLEELFNGSNSFLLTILTDASGTEGTLLRNLLFADIHELHEVMKEDRIFKRIIKMLDEEGLGWDFRVNQLTERVIKGDILQLSIYKK